MFSFVTFIVEQAEEQWFGLGCGLRQLTVSSTMPDFMEVSLTWLWGKWQEEEFLFP